VGAQAILASLVSKR